METTEKIVESYCRYVRNWLTMPNIRCDGQYEIDLLAVDTTNRRRLTRYHIECSVSIASGFSKLNTKEFMLDLLKDRVQAARQRRTLGYFVDRKFNVPEVRQQLAKYGFCDDNYRRVIVTWDATQEAKESAREKNIEIWDFRELLNEIADTYRENRTYFTDDTARTIQMFALASRSRTRRGEPISR